MCGIVGIVENNKSFVDQALLSSMCQAMRHRGPDDDGFYFSEGVGLGMRRLSIIDVKGGQQPIHNQDRTADFERQDWVSLPAILERELLNMIQQQLAASDFEEKTASIPCDMRGRYMSFTPSRRNRRPAAKPRAGTSSW